MLPGMAGWLAGCPYECFALDEAIGFCGGLLAELSILTRLWLVVILLWLLLPFLATIIAGGNKLWHECFGDD